MNIAGEHARQGRADKLQGRNQLGKEPEKKEDCWPDSIGAPGILF